KGIKIGIYEQEIAESYLSLTLTQAIERAYMAKDVPIGESLVKQLLSDYLFNPATDGDVPISRLSGGQKARFQLINMLAGHPQVLILDEPTNHLDLPSIEELEDALAHYNGAIVYISHDSYFARHLGGDTITIDNKA
ncbi:ABC-F family ATP-binding cassette domain-containing protein, partial [Candidatus Saccharibacteria bacterium]|nr:ABC-F family ATP-binding cassette domain-containing protein [Candidatus Saccharibacteria bacterium]